MRYEIHIHELAAEEIEPLRAYDQRRIVDAIEQQLSYQETVPTRRRYADEAVTLLRQAVAAGFKDFTHMQTDPDLAAIREHAGYKELVEKKTK